MTGQQSVDVTSIGAGPPTQTRTEIGFEVSRIVPMAPDSAWQRLIDWRSHGNWIPMTRVEVSDADPTCFTAWSGVGRFSLEDQMQLVDMGVDDDTRWARIAKIGPVLFGETEFSVSSGIVPDSALVRWREVVNVPYLPQWLSPVAAWIGRRLFFISLGRMARS